MIFFNRVIGQILVIGTVLMGVVLNVHALPNTSTLVYKPSEYRPGEFNISYPGGNDEWHYHPESAGDFPLHFDAGEIDATNSLHHYIVDTEHTGLLWEIRRDFYWWNFLNNAEETPAFPEIAGRLTVVWATNHTIYGDTDIVYTIWYSTAGPAGPWQRLETQSYGAGESATEEFTASTIINLADLENLAVRGTAWVNYNSGLGTTGIFSVYEISVEPIFFPFPTELP